LIEAEREYALALGEQYEMDIYDTLKYFMEMIKIEAQEKLAEIDSIMYCVEKGA
jgi:hypothetical protein